MLPASNPLILIVSNNIRGIEIEQEEEVLSLGKTGEECGTFALKIHMFLVSLFDFVSNTYCLNRQVFKVELLPMKEN